MKSLILSVALLAVQADEKALKDRQAEIMAFVRIAKGDREYRAAAGDLAKLAQQAFEVNLYDLSVKIYGDAERLARTALKDAPLAKALQDSVLKTTSVGKEYAKASKAISRILSQEGTPDDYTVSGRFLCFVKGAWESGLADLSKGKDETLKRLAEEDIAGGNPAALADAWLNLIKKEPSAKDRALYWYGIAWPKVMGVDREKMRRILHQMQGIPVGAGKKGVPVGGWSGLVEEGFGHTGKRCGAILPLEKSNAGGYVSFNSPVIPVISGQKINFSVWVLSDRTNVEGGVWLSFFDANNKVLENGGPGVLPDNPFWIRMEREYVAPQAAVTMQVRAWSKDTQGTIWIDDVSLKIDGAESLKQGSFE